jgi:hypothetical protein
MCDCDLPWCLGSATPSTGAALGAGWVRRWEGSALEAMARVEVDDG